MNNSVRVDIEGHLDLRQAPGRWRNADKVELPKHLVVRCHLAFPLKNADRDGRLIVLGGGEDLGFLGRDGRVAVDQFRHHAAQRFDAKRERRDVEEEDVLHIALQHSCLDRGPDCHNFIGVDALVRVFAEFLADRLLDLRHARLAAYQDDLLDLPLAHACILQGGIAGRYRALNKVRHQPFELGTRQLLNKMLRSILICCDEGQIDFGLHR